MSWTDKSEFDENAVEFEFFPRKQDPLHRKSAWLTSYSDLITLLLVFFILLAASSNINASKLQSLSQTLRGVQSSTSIKSIHEIVQEVAANLEKHGLTDVVAIVQDVDGVQLVIRDSLLFNSGEAILSKETGAQLKPVFETFLQLPSYYKFSVEGHTDDVPIASSRYPNNWHLSAARALAVLSLLESYGFSQERISMRAFGDTIPLVPNRDSSGEPLPDNRRKNRRVVIRIR